VYIFTCASLSFLVQHITCALLPFLVHHSYASYIKALYCTVLLHFNIQRIIHNSNRIIILVLIIVEVKATSLPSTPSLSSSVLIPPPKLSTKNKLGYQFHTCIETELKLCKYKYIEKDDEFGICALWSFIHCTNMRLHEDEHDYHVCQKCNYTASKKKKPMPIFWDFVY
jgi:hypothetical protein